MSRAQLANQAFIYILTAIIFSFVIILGYKAVNHFQEVGKQVEMIDFKMELESSINNIAPTQDRIQKTMNIPKGFRQLCMLDMTEGGESNCAMAMKSCGKVCSAARGIPGVVCDAWRDNLTQNVFLLPMSEVPIKTARIELRDGNNDNRGYLCLNLSKSRVRLEFEGRGDRTIIREISS